MFLIGAKIRNTRGKLAHAGDVGASCRQKRGRHATECLTHHLRGTPTEASYELGKIAAARRIKSGLDSRPHNVSVIQNPYLYYSREPDTYASSSSLTRRTRTPGTKGFCRNPVAGSFRSGSLSVYPDIYSTF